MSHVSQNSANADANCALHFAKRLRINDIPYRADELHGDIIAISKGFRPYKASKNVLNQFRLIADAGLRSGGTGSFVHVLIRPGDADHALRAIAAVACGCSTVATSPASASVKPASTPNTTRR